MRLKFFGSRRVYTIAGYDQDENIIVENQRRPSYRSFDDPLPRFPTVIDETTTMGCLGSKPETVKTNESFHHVSTILEEPEEAIYNEPDMAVADLSLAPEVVADESKNAIVQPEVVADEPKTEVGKLEVIADVPEVVVDDEGQDVAIVGEGEKEEVNKKKDAISAESAVTVNRADEIHIAKYTKDKATVEIITAALMENQFLSLGLDSKESIKSVVDAMYFETVPSGTFVITEGESGDKLYVCEKGSLDVLQKNIKVNTLGPGKAFGELAVLYRSPRNASIIATTNCNLWVLERKVYQKAMMKAGMERSEKNIKFLKSVTILSKLDRPTLSQISDLVKVEYFKNADVIIRQGDTGSKFYIISSGSVRVTVANADNSIETELELTKGHYFGERALLTNDVRKATVTAIDKTECLVLDRDPFIKLLGSLEELQKNANTQPLPPRASENENGIDNEFSHVRLTDLNIIGTLGVGGFGRVELVQLKKNPMQTFALKKVKKMILLEQQQIQHILDEKKIMLRCRSPFIARLYKTYNDKQYLYLLMESCMGADIWTLLQRHRHFDEQTTKFMVACVIEGLDYLHGRGYIYRDLKPENMMLNSNGYLKIIDFGFAKKVPHGSKAWTFVGTPEYIAPEILRNHGHDRAADYWSLGVFIYELLVSRPPFNGHNQYETYNAIARGIEQVHFPLFLSQMAINIIKRLCKQEPTLRLGYLKEGIMGIKNHRWFRGFDWEALKAQTMTAPIIPRLNDHLDMSNFQPTSADRDIAPEVNDKCFDGF